MAFSAYRISKNTTKEILIAWLLPFILLVVYSNLFGIFDDTLYDSIASNYLRGNLSIDPVDNFFVYYIVLSKVFAKFYGWFPSVPWLGCFLIGLLYLSVGVCFTLLHRMLTRGKIALLFQVALLYGCFHVCWFEHFQLLNITKVAVCSAGIGMLFLGLRLKSIDGRSDFFLQIVCWLMIILGVLTRWETAGMAIVYCVAVLPFISDSAIQVLKVFSGVAVLLVFMFGYEYFFLQGEDDKYFNSTEPFIFNFHDADNRTAALADMKTRSDSARYIAAEHWFFNDKEKLNIEFLKKITVASTPLRLDFGYLLQKWKSAVPSFKELFVERCFGMTVLMVLVLMIACLLYLVNPSKNLAELGAAVFIPVVFFALIVAVALIVKIEFRASAPLFTVMLTTLVLFVIGIYCSVSVTMGVKWLIQITLFVFFAVYWQGQADYYIGLCHYETAEIEFVTKAKEEIDQRYSGRIIIPDCNAGVQLLCSSPLVNSELTHKNTWVFYDFAYSTFYPPFSKYLIQVFGSEKAVDIFDYAKKHSEKFVFIATEERIRFYEQYFQSVYKLPLHFVKDDAPTVLSSGGLQVGWQKSYHYYTLSPS